MENIHKPLSNVQLELMKLYGTNLNDQEIIELRDELAKFYAKKSIKASDKVWDEKGLTNADMDAWLNKKS
jgi:hypothetical protein